MMVVPSKFNFCTVALLYGCYVNDEASLMGCTNCVWGGLGGEGGASCDEVDGVAQIDYESCGDLCKNECDEAVESGR